MQGISLTLLLTIAAIGDVIAPTSIQLLPCPAAVMAFWRRPVIRLSLVRAFQFPERSKARILIMVERTSHITTPQQDHTDRTMTTRRIIRCRRFANRRTWIFTSVVVTAVIIWS